MIAMKRTTSSNTDKTRHRSPS